jgi:O-antigen/teichoic acid export membrane protein
MAGRLLRRRTGAAVGTYASIAFGFLGSIAAARMFSRETFGLYALVMASTGFFQTLLDLTIEEALIKFGFRYITAEDWGRLRRLFRRTFAFKLVGAVLAGGGLLALAAGSRTVFGHSGLRLPLAIAAAIPLLQAPEGMSAVPLMLRGRYDLRGGFLAFSMALRLTAILLGASHGLAWTIGAIAVAQALASLAIGTAGAAAFGRFPRVDPQPLGEDRKSLLRFIAQSSGATGVVSLRSTLTPMILGIVSTVTQVGYLRAAQSPQQGFTAVSAPIRMVLLTEQTRDWERGNRAAVFAGVRRYMLGATVGSIVLMPVVLVFMPEIIRLLVGAKYLGAVPAARVALSAGAVQFVVGWQKSFAVTSGRPQLRIWTHGLESVVLLPLAAVLGWRSGAVGAATAILISSVVFAAAWLVLLVRIRREPFSPREVVAPTSAASREAHA